MFGDFQAVWESGPSAVLRVYNNGLRLDWVHFKPDMRICLAYMTSCWFFYVLVTVIVHESGLIDRSLWRVRLTVNRYLVGLIINHCKCPKFLGSYTCSVRTIFLFIFMVINFCNLLTVDSFAKINFCEFLPWQEEREMHHNHFTTLLQGSKAWSMQFFKVIFKLGCIQNHVIENSVTKKFVCI